MELKEKITLDMLTKDSVSVLRQQFLTFNGEEMQATIQPLTSLSKVRCKR
ncbi:MAG: hypothetical protein KHX38_02905 [Ruminococcus sp.]|nr:hypothetical protein [Ruminococcus sp.]MBS5452459.1 hypothetical protein [Ruminococcus sp.]